MAGLSMPTYSTPSACSSVGTADVRGACSYYVTLSANDGAEARRNPPTIAGLTPAVTVSPTPGVVNVVSSNSMRVLRGEGA